MGKLVCALATSHNPSLMVPADRWNPIYQRLISRRTIETPLAAQRETLEINIEQYDRCMAALGILKGVLAASRPDAVVIVGDDQDENFHLDNMPPFCVFSGQELFGYPFKLLKSYLGEPPGERLTIRGHSEFAMKLLEHGADLGFDLSYSKQMPDRNWGLPHSIIRILYHVLPSPEVRVVPVHVNAYHPPCPTPARCYQLGEGIRRIVTEHTPEDFRVAVIGSGGLSHDPLGPKAGLINESHDRWVLDCFSKGKAHELSRLSSQDLIEALDVELRNWIIVAGGVGTTSPTFTEYVPSYRTVVGMGFAAWKLHS